MGETPTIRIDAKNVWTANVGDWSRVPHELRHTATSLVIASGASIKGVQLMLGQASAAMTLDRYGHLFGDELEAVVDRMAAAPADWIAD